MLCSAFLAVAVVGCAVGVFLGSLAGAALLIFRAFT